MDGIYDYSINPDESYALDVHKLSVELWQTIFWTAMCTSFDGYSLPYSLSIQYSYSKSHWSVKAMFPILLSHVCTHWRDIVYTFPKLWASICVHIFDGKTNTGAKKLLETFLEKSVQCPLDLKIVMVDRPLSGLLGIWELLMHHFSRAARLTIFFNGRMDDTLAAFHNRELTFSELSLFRASDIDPSKPFDNNNPFWMALRQAPALKKLRLPRIHTPNSFPYHQLTTLFLDHIDIDDVTDLLHVLEISTNIRSLMLNTTTVHDMLPSNIVPRRVELPFLQTLSFNLQSNGVPVIDDSILEVLLASLVVPSLSTFKLYGRNFPEQPVNDWPPSLLTMLKNSAPTLTDIVLILFLGEPVTWPSFSVLFETTPNLTHLEVVDFRVGSLLVRPSSTPANYSFPSELLLSELTFTNQAIPLLPKLRSLYVTGMRKTRENMESLFSLITSRSPSRLSEVNDIQVRPLMESYSLPFDTGTARPFDVESELQDVMEGLKQQGVEVIVECSDVNEEDASTRSRYLVWEAVDGLGSFWE